MEDGTASNPTIEPVLVENCGATQVCATSPQFRSLSPPDWVDFSSNGDRMKQIEYVLPRHSVSSQGHRPARHSTGGLPPRLSTFRSIGSVSVRPGQLEPLRPPSGRRASFTSSLGGSGFTTFTPIDTIDAVEHASGSQLWLDESSSIQLDSLAEVVLFLPRDRMEMFLDTPIVENACQTLRINKSELLPPASGESFVYSSSQRRVAVLVLLKTVALQEEIRSKRNASVVFSESISTVLEDTMSARQRARPVTVEHLKEVCEREQEIALEKKQRAIEKHQRREEKLQTIQAQKLAHAEAVQQARREKLSSDITRDSSGSLAAESRLEEIQDKLENSLTLSGSVALLKANKAKSHNDRHEQRKLQIAAAEKEKQQRLQEKLRQQEEKLAAAARQRSDHYSEIKNKAKQQARLWGVHVRNAALLQQTKDIEAERLAASIEEKDMRRDALHETLKQAEHARHLHAQRESVALKDFTASFQRESKRTPGPLEYLPPSEFNKMHTVGGTFSSQLSATMFDNVSRAASLTPGPASYPDANVTAVKAKRGTPTFAHDSHTWLTAHHQRT